VTEKEILLSVVPLLILAVIVFEARRYDRSLRRTMFSPGDVLRDRNGERWEREEITIVEVGTYEYLIKRDAGVPYGVTKDYVNSAFEKVEPEAEKAESMQIEDNIALRVEGVEDWILSMQSAGEMEGAVRMVDPRTRAVYAVRRLE
jgi:hypothetical protein